MSIEQKFGNLFKPEVKSSARKLASEEKVSIASGSDTFIQAYVRVSPAVKVTLNSEGVSASTFTADCSCVHFKKNRFCKHLWATLILVEENYADFLSEKREIEKQINEDAAPTKQTQYQETAKQKASDYRKEQYQKQKAHLKEKKRERRGLDHATSRSAFTPEIEAALAYFSLNGFPMPGGPSREILSEAKRTLSRVFHPDKGGTHAESTELNQNCELLLQFLGD